MSSEISYFKKLSAVILTTLTLISFLTSAGFAASAENGYKGFSDVPDGKWFSEPIRFVVEHGFFTGTANDRFSPAVLMSRAMFVTVLAKVAGADLSEYSEKVFDDVSEKNYYFRASGWAYANGIVSGKGERRFAPDDPISRQEVCLMMVKYLAYKGLSLPVTVSGETFADDKQIAGWARDAVYKIRSYGVISGKPGNNADPKGTASRAETATMIMRLAMAQEEAEKDTFTAFVRRPFVGLYRNYSDDTPEITLIYMDKVVYLGTEKKYDSGAWLRVRYDDRVYYMWEPDGTQDLTRAENEENYNGTTEITQKMLDLAMELYSLPSAYRHGESNGIPASDGTYGFDCSGFVSYIMDTVMSEYVPTFNVSASLINLFNCDTIYNKGIAGEFKPADVDIADILPGDIIFFNLQDEANNEDHDASLPVSHCGMYLGDGEFIHCTHYNFGPNGIFIMPLTEKYSDSIVRIRRMAPDSPSSANEKRFVIPFSANVRDEMSLNSNIIDTISAETEVTLLYTDSDFISGEPRWAYISYGNGKTGYISASSLTDRLNNLEETRYVASTAVKLYEKPDTSTAFTQALCTSEVIYNGVYANSHFHKVRYEGRDLFLYCSEETDLNSLVTTDQEALLKGKGERTLLKSSNLRSRMDSSDPDSVIRLLRKNETVTLIAVSPSGTWSYVRTESGSCGFVVSSALGDAE